MSVNKDTLKNKLQTLETRDTLDNHRIYMRYGLIERSDRYG
jgi:hypothetical protein